MRHLDFPPVWLAAFIFGVWLWQAMGLPGSVQPGSLLRLAGVLLVGLGAGLMGLAVVALAQARTTVVPHRVPSALVTGGIFRLSRNPIYLGDVLGLVGAALWLGAPGALVLVPGLIWCLTVRFIQPEEARMQATFGAAYDSYAARTRRWV